MKKIGILVNSIGYGGNERSAVNIAEALRTRLDVTVIIQEDKGNHYGFGGRVVNLDTPCAASTAGKAVNSIRRIIRLKKVLRKERIETLFIILPVSNPINYLSLGCRKIVSCRHCGDLEANTEKYIRMTEKSDLIVCNSVFQADYLSEAAPGLKSKARAIYNIIDTDRIDRLKAEEPDEAVTNFLEGRRYIVSTGRFDYGKGLSDLLKSFFILAGKDPELRLIMIGDGPYRPKIEKLAGDLKLRDRVLLPGFQDNPFRYIARAAAFVLPSTYEGFPNTLAEAMTCGVPVIATDCPSGPAEILCGEAKQGFSVTEYGILTETFTEKDGTWNAEDIRPVHRNFAGAIEQVLADRELATNLAEAARRRAGEFSADRIAEEWEKIL